MLHCCTKFPRINNPSQESDQHTYIISPTMRFHVYKIISRCKVHCRCHFNKNKQFQLCEDSSDPKVNAEIYKKIACHDREFNCGLSSTFIHTSLSP